MTLSVWQSFLDWVERGHWGDVASILGVLISVVGFVATIRGVLKSKSAAESAQRAAEGVRTTISQYQAIGGLSEAVAIIEEIKRMHRAGTWAVLPDRYAAVRKILISVKASHSGLQPAQQRRLTSAIQQFGVMEEQVEGICMSKGAEPEVVRYNSIASKQIEALITLLEELRLS